MVLQCKFLHFAFSTVEECFPPYDVHDTMLWSSLELVEKYLAEPLKLPPSILAWAAIEANWVVRWEGLLFSESYFLRIYMKILNRWQQSRVPCLRPAQLSSFTDLLLSLQRGDPGNGPQLDPIPPLPPSRAQLRAKRRLERKMRSLDKLSAHLDSVEGQG